MRTPLGTFWTLIMVVVSWVHHQTVHIKRIQRDGRKYGKASAIVNKGKENYGYYPYTFQVFLEHFLFFSK